MASFSSTTVDAMDPYSAPGRIGPLTNFVFNFVEHEERSKTFFDDFKDVCRIHYYPPDQLLAYRDGNRMMCDVRTLKKVMDCITELT